MSQWYLNKKGQALGPFEESKIISLIESGDVKPMDLIYQAGASEWIPISQVENFASHFQKASKDPEPKPDSSSEREWVLLKKIVSDKGKEYKQIGPFSQPEVMDLLDKGKVRFTDFAWKKGMESWAKIGEMDDFEEPLPSSPAIDMSLYEKTNPDIDESTVVDEEKKASMTELVNIESFQRQKTQVMMPSTGSELPDSPEDSPEEGPQEVTATSHDESPLMSQEFATVTGMNEESESDISLWSLEPPSSSTKIEAEKQENTDVGDISQEKTRVVSIDDAKELKARPPKAPKIPKPKAMKELKSKEEEKEAAKKLKEEKRKKSKEQKEQLIAMVEKLSMVEPETWLWVSAVGAVTLSILFFYMSFHPGNTELVYDESVTYEDTNANLGKDIVEDPPNIWKEKMKGYKEKLVEPEIVDNYDEPEEIPINDVKVESVANEPKPLPVVKTQPVQKVAPVIKPQPAPQTTVKTEPPVNDNRDVASKSAKTKKQLKEQAQKMSRSKRKKAKPKAKAKSRPSSRVSKPSGGKKAQSYYEQRDRKALFYSSLRAETLAVDIEKNYKKLRTNKKAWSNYYGQWRKKVQNSLAKEIREYPKRSELYAYPQFFKSFKKDYQMFYKYGESFNMKVIGGRVPASSEPQNLRKLFSGHKNRAKSLGI